MNFATPEQEIRERAVELTINRGKRMADDDVSFFVSVQNMEEYLRDGTLPTRR